MGEEVTMARACWNTTRRTRLGALEYVTLHPMCEERPRGHGGLHAGLHDPDYFGSLVEQWDEGCLLEWGLDCLSVGDQDGLYMRSQIVCDRQ